MNIKQYVRDNVSYHYSLQAQKWVFEVPQLNHTMLVPCPERAKTAFKVAGALIGASKRGSVDGLARATINCLCYV